MHRRAFLSVCAIAAAFCCSALTHAATLFPTNTFSATNNPAGVVLADLRGKGLKDIVEIGQNGYIEVLLNQGNGTYAPPVVAYQTDGIPTAVAVADVNGDGHPDIIVVNVPGNVVEDISGTLTLVSKNGNDVTVLLGNGDGTFQGQQLDNSGVTPTSYPVGSNPISMALVDLNGDGHPDIVVANQSGNSLSVLLGNSNGTFQSAVTYPVGTAPDCVAAVDVNGDGHPDILVANAVDNTLGLLIGNGDGTFQAERTFSLGSAQTGTQGLSFVVGKLTSSGAEDVVIGVLGGETGSVEVFLNDGAGNFTAGGVYSAGLNARTLLLADLKNRGILDLIAASSSDNVVNVLFGNGDGTFGGKSTYATAGLSTAPAEQVVATGDVDGDGFPDLVVANPAAQSMQVLHNQGTGNPGDFRAVNPCGTVCSSPSAVATGKLTASGNLDLVVANAAPNGSGNYTVGVFLGDGHGNFTPTASSPVVGKSPQAVVLADLKSRGVKDIVTANFGDGTVSVLLGNGDGTFQTQQVYKAVPNTPGATVLGAVVADINGDKIPDIIVANGVSNTVGILLGNGDGTFQPIQTFASDNSLDAIAAADVDGDGIPDIVTVGGVVTIFHNAMPQCTLPVVAGASCEQAGNIPTSFTPVASYSVPGVQLALGNLKNRFWDAPNNTRPVLDLVVADYTRGGIDVMLANTATPGTFGTPLNYASANGSSSVALADVNGDQNLDAVVTNSLSNSVSVLFGNGQGAFLNNSYPVDVSPRLAAIGDFNGDGFLDLAVANSGSDTLSIMLQVAGLQNTDPAPTASAGTLTIPDGKVATEGLLSASSTDSSAVLTFGIVSQPGNGTVTLDPATGLYTYQANSQYVGTDTFSFQVTDGVKLSSPPTVVTVTVQTNSSVTSSSGAGAFGILPLLLLAPFVRRRRRDA